MNLPKYNAIFGNSIAYTQSSLPLKDEVIQFLKLDKEPAQVNKTKSKEQRTKKKRAKEQQNKEQRAKEKRRRRKDRYYYSINSTQSSLPLKDEMIQSLKLDKEPAQVIQKKENKEK